MSATATHGIDPSTGEFTWTPSAGGTYTFDVTVTDAGGLFDTESVTINVSALLVSKASAVRNGRIVTVIVLLTNKTSSAITGVSVTAASLAGINTNSRLPLLYGTIKPGASKQCKLQFKNVPAGQQTFTLDGTSSIGAIFSTQDVNMP